MGSIFKVFAEYSMEKHQFDYLIFVDYCKHYAESGSDKLKCIMQLINQIIPQQGIKTKTKSIPPIVDLDEIFRKTCQKKFYLKKSEKIKNFIETIWAKVFKNGPSKICGRAFKKLYLVLLECFVPFITLPPETALLPLLRNSKALKCNGNIFNPISTIPQKIFQFCVPYLQDLTVEKLWV